jgi:uncharacterized protein involved in exopolysaccharide biosynthesis
MSDKKTILDFDADADGMEISELFQFLIDNIKTVFGITSGITILAIIYSLLVTPIFQAEVIAIPAKDQKTAGSSLAKNFSGLASVAGIVLPGGNADSIETTIAIAESKKFNILFVKQENLLPLLFKKDWNEEDQSWIDGEVPTDLGAQSAIKDHYSIGYDKRDGIITISMNWDDPILAAKYANNYVTSINNYIRADEIAEAQKSIEFLKIEIQATKLVDIRNALNSLIQDQLQTIMLANIRDDYVFKVIDPAMVPKSKIKPQRTQIVLVGFFFGLILSILTLIIRKTYNI